jgi:hypothetical protein
VLASFPAYPFPPSKFHIAVYNCKVKNEGRKMAGWGKGTAPKSAPNKSANEDNSIPASSTDDRLQERNGGERNMSFAVRDMRAAGGWVSWRSRGVGLGKFSHGEPAAAGRHFVCHRKNDSWYRDALIEGGAPVALPYPAVLFLQCFGPSIQVPRGHLAGGRHAEPHCDCRGSRT